MAYDPNDPADKKIVSDAVAAALADAQEAHENDIEGLKTKNKELTEKLRKARNNSDSVDAGEVDRLENELSEVNSQLRSAKTELGKVKRDLEAVTTERDAANTDLTAEREYSRSTLIENSLTSALAGANVAPEFTDAVKALLGKDVTVKEVNGERQAFKGDKSLGDFVKEWSLGDQGKHYVKAPANGGGQDGNQQPSGQPGAKKIAEMTQAERTAHYNKIGQAAFDSQVEAERNAA